MRPRVRILAVSLGHWQGNWNTWAPVRVYCPPFPPLLRFAFHLHRHRHITPTTSAIAVDDDGNRSDALGTVRETCGRTKIVHVPWGWPHELVVFLLPYWCDEPVATLGGEARRGGKSRAEES